MKKILVFFVLLIIGLIKSLSVFIPIILFCIYHNNIFIFLIFYISFILGKKILKKKKNWKTIHEISYFKCMIISNILFIYMLSALVYPYDILTTILIGMGVGAWTRIIPKQ